MLDVAETGSLGSQDPWLDPQADRIADCASDTFERICRRSDRERGQRSFALPGCDLEVRYVGRPVGDALCGAFDHLDAAIGGDVPRLEWRIADRSGIADLPAMPDPPRPLHSFGSLHRNGSNTLLIERRRGFVTVLDQQAMRLTTIVDGARSIDTDLAAKPLLRFLMSLLLTRGVVLCHAALVGGRDAGLLVTGKGGAGKSTITAAALTGGAGFCADDFVALERRDGELIGHCLYSTVMLTGEQMARFPALAEHATRLRRDTFAKHLVRLAVPFRDRIVRSMRIDGVAVPHIVGTATSALVPASRAAMLRAIAPTSVFSSPWREVERTRFLFEQVGRLEPMHYRSGSDFSKISDPLRDRYGY